MRTATIVSVAAVSAAAIFGLPAAAHAQEVFAGVYKHAVDTPFTLYSGEDGFDVELGYRFAPIRALAFVGSPSPYVIGSLNNAGDTSFAGAGMSWRFGITGPVYIRPGVGLIVHTGPGYRYDAGRHQETDLGSRVLFEPELGLGYRIGPRTSIEASWTHISGARLFNAQQNPGIDMWGARVNFHL